MKFLLKMCYFCNDKIVLDIMKQQIYLLLYTRKQLDYIFALSAALGQIKIGVSALLSLSG